MTQPPVPPQPGQPYPGQQFPQPTPPKKKRKWPWILGGVVALIVIVAATSGGDKKEDETTAASATTSAAEAPAAGAPAAKTTTTTKAPAAKKTVVYEVTSDSGTAGNITYFGENAQQSQSTDVTLPWKSKEFDSSKVSIKAVTAQNGGSGTISCKITVNGKVEAENTSEGAYAVVSCNGKLF